MLCFRKSIRQLYLCLTKHWSFKTIIINILKALRLPEGTEGTQYKNVTEGNKSENIDLSILNRNATKFFR